MKEPVWLDERTALALHDRLLALDGGLAGIRDEGLLKPALVRPQQYWIYADQADFIAPAALYTASVVRNHPFADGNKRTGFVLGVLFLELNGYRFNASEEDAAQAVIALAAGTLAEVGYTAFLHENVVLQQDSVSS